MIPDLSVIPPMQHQLDDRPEHLQRPEGQWDGIAYWPSCDAWSWQQTYSDGACRVNSDILPPLALLVRRATQIAQGCFARKLFEASTDSTDYRLWLDLVKMNPAQLDLEGKIDYSHNVSYWISFREAGDPDSYGHSGSYHQPDFAYASMIVQTQQRFLESDFENLYLDVATGRA